ncbi:COG4223 family protein [Devosia sp. CN2-171]|uniref:COG4223 family protein n=1 Tax=Devosia sp. CN2-171 TaxID=3400909 RepID=UPI003BF83A73
MAQRKSGPVKPPVIDLKAREAEPAASTTEARAEEAVTEAAQEAAAEVSEAAPAEEPARTPPPLPRPQARLAMPWSAISIAAVGGALLGAGLVYALGNWLPLPNKVPVIADPAIRLDAQDASLGTIDGRLVALEEQTRRTQVSLDATIAQLDAGLNEVRRQIAVLPEAAPATDLAPIEAQLESLSDRVTAIGAGASSADATALAQTITTIEAGIAELRTEVTDNEGKVTAIEGSIAALQSDVAALKSALSTANQGSGTADIGPAVRLPLVVSGLESAAINGRPYAAELDSLRVLLPDLAIPPEIAASAEAGLPRADTVAARFSAAVPDILAGRSATGTGDIGADALEWMKGLLALRPSGEIAGDTPEAIVSQLEAAVGRRDFATAAQLLGALPPAMQAGAGTAGADIVKLATADKFLTDLRARALAPSAEVTP